MDITKQYRILSVKPDEEVNIGDYIQALAASIFMPHVDGFVDRESIRDYNDAACKIIMNGWFMHNPEQWPPSPFIDPLFIAFHINSLAKQQMLSQQSIDYLKAHEPIGCRDRNTEEILLEKGVNAYFSGCLTLTLGLKYKSQKRQDTVYFVDPFFETKWNLKNTVNSALHLLTHWKAINTIAKKYPESKKGLRKRMILANFHKQYVRIFSEDVLLNATYICQQSSYYHKFSSDDELMKEAERLVKLYANASLVVTSRIHCALPCLGLETPVVFTDNALQSETSKCRFGGLRELFNILRWENGMLHPEFQLNGKISATENIPCNKNNWKPLAKKLEEKVKQWIL